MEDYLGHNLISEMESLKIINGVKHFCNRPYNKFDQIIMNNIKKPRFKGVTNYGKHPNILAVNKKLKNKSVFVILCNPIS